MTAKAIKRYLHDHPQASDTVDGVGRWWLAPQQYPLPDEHVREALERLAALGVVKCRRLPDGTVIYSAAERPPEGSHNV